MAQTVVTLSTQTALRNDGGRSSFPPLFSMRFGLFVLLGASYIFKPQPFSYAVPRNQIPAQFRTRAGEEGVPQHIVIDHSFAQAVFFDQAHHRNSHKSLVFPCSDLIMAPAESGGFSHVNVDVFRSIILFSIMLDIDKVIE